MSDKKTVRKEVRNQLAEITDKIWVEASQERTASLVQWLNERPEITKVALYSALPTEIDLQMVMLLASRVEWHFPVVTGEKMTFHRVSDRNTLKHGFKGILEPNPQVHPPVRNEDLDLVLCPGLAFTDDGKRLGRGGGFYDRFLESAPQALRFGVCLEEQILHSLPTDAHDVRMTHLIQRGVGVMNVV